MLANPNVNLWDGIGCGGAQNGEVAKLDEMRPTDHSGRWEYHEVDVTEFLGGTIQSWAHG